MKNNNLEINISDRLKNVANLVKQGNVVADIGTDHGMLPIFLVHNGISPKAFAMDLRKGPLQTATANIAKYNLSDKIETRLSNGLEMLDKGEAQTITICGMGGRLIKTILVAGNQSLNNGDQLVLSPQSELREFRLFLKKSDIAIYDEKMVYDDGKYYNIFDCCVIDNKKIVDVEESDEQGVYFTDLNVESDIQKEANLRYGEKLIGNKDAVLRDFLEKEKTELLSVIGILDDKISSKNDDVANENIDKRKAQLLIDLSIVNWVLQRM